MKKILVAALLCLNAQAEAQEAGRFQIVPPGGERIWVWVLDTLTGHLKACFLRSPSVECSPWEPVNLSDQNEPK